MKRRGEANTQRRLAASVLKIGQTRVWFDPEALDEINSAMTRGDVRKYIGLGYIKKRPKIGNSRGRIRKRHAQKAKGRQKGQGKRRGSANARLGKKSKWMVKIRGQRSLLKHLRDSEKISKTVYRKVYRLAKAGSFKHKAHLITYLRSKAE
ncbi:TPA: 50S ribosomal protein L19e [archaeon]|jgi:large subunit ribosomal protein L19e|uniref:Large ribosomal subunit protein eL19 n=1 Tax=Candidatus Undinarchaeum marinum TaxID=2756141 RepID=A0A832X5B7_9ARCH|nr:50S ribosomal protein L19e [Candidatus Undinarchaeum marinum]